MLQLLDEIKTYVYAADYAKIIGGAALLALGAAVRSIFSAFISLPARAAMRKYNVVKYLSRAFIIKHPSLSGVWYLEWNVASENFPQLNLDKVIMYKFLGYFALEPKNITSDGSEIAYSYVGKNIAGIITGEWFDSRDSAGGYYGTFQVVVDPTMHVAEGQWLGFSRDRTVKSGRLVLKKIK